MKIAYILSSDIARYRGSTMKVWNQAQEWRYQGHSVEIFSLTPDNSPALMETNRFVKRKSALVDKFLPYTGLLKKVEEFDPDIVYFRYSLPNSTFAKLQKKYSSVIEINTDDNEEYRKLFYVGGGLKSFLLWQINSLLRGSFLKRAEGLISVTNEISNRRAFTVYNKNISVIPNSVSLSGETLKLKNGVESPVKLFFIGSPGMDWHGVDKLCSLAESLKDDIEVHIVGADGENSGNIFWYGYLEEKEYLKIMSECHICVGTLALHRKGLSEACPLKVREYLKYGFPVILGYKDTAFLEKRPLWVLELPDSKELAYNSGVVESIKDFCIEYRDVIVSKEEAEPYISSRIIESRRLDFMKKVVKTASK